MNWMIQLVIRRRRVEEKASTCERTSYCAMHGWPLASILSMEWSKRAQPFGGTFIYGSMSTSISRPTLTCLIRNREWKSLNQRWYTI